MKFNYLFLLSCLFLFACNSDDDTNPTSNNDGPIMIVEKDGVEFTAESFNNTLLSEQQGNEVGRRLDLRCQIDGGTFIISVANWDWQNPPENGVLEKIYDTNVDSDNNNGIGPNAECMDDGSFTYCDSGLVTYLVGTNTYFSDFLDDEPIGQIVIESNDAANKTVSGSFDVVVGDLLGTQKFTFKGTFSNLNY